MIPFGNGNYWDDLMEHLHRTEDVAARLHRVLVVDDEAPFRELLVRRIGRLGHFCDSADGGARALELLRSEDFDVACVDLVMPDMDGLALLSAIIAADLDVVVVMVSGVGTIATAVEAMKLGAFDFVEKEPTVDVLRATLERAFRHGEVRRRARQMEMVAQQWETTFDAVPDLITVVDNNYRILRVNKAMAERLGRPATEIVGETCYCALHGTSEPVSYCPHGRSLAVEQRHFVGFSEPRLGGHFLMSTSPLYARDGTLLGRVHVARDITEQKKGEEMLQRAHKDTERLLASMSTFLIEVDTQWNVTRWNTAAEACFGLQASSAVGKPFRECGIRWNWEDVMKCVDNWEHREKPLRISAVKYARADGTEGFLDMTVNSVRNDEGLPDGFFFLGSDVTERMNLELQLAQAQKLESIGQLAAGIAHEINTPTQYVGDNLEFLQYAFEDFSRVCEICDGVLAAAKGSSLTGATIADVEAKLAGINVEYLRVQVPKAIEQSLDGVKRVASIVRAMKEFSHPGTGEKTRIDLNAAIESTVTVSRNEWKYVADVVTEYDAGLPYVNCLPGELNQAILNIIVNAAHAIGDVVGSGSKGKGKITIRTRRDGDFAEITIADTGPGIPESIRGRIFDPFFTTKDVGRGTGQGLAIAHNVIVERHEGSITFKTEAGQGTTFFIRLPIEGGEEND
jgi:PAS domain S-box-containing protein